MLFDMASEVGPRVGHQRVGDKRQRRRRALDVQQNGLHTRGRAPDAHARGNGEGVRYDGPKHTGWNPWSMPVSV